MNREELIKLNLDSLCLYKNIFNDKIGYKFKVLIDSLVNENNIGICIKNYNDFAYSLLNYDKALSFKEALVNEIILTSNNFNCLIEADEEIPNFIEVAVKNEFKILEQISLVNSNHIKDILIEKYNEEYIIDKIKALISWGCDYKTYINKNSSDFEEIKALLLNNNSWDMCVESLVKFHSKNGIGRSSAYSAFVWERYENEDEGRLREIVDADPIKLSDLVGYEIQKKEIISNTISFLKGLPANNLLLYGARGTGKSSTVKAILNEYSNKGLRIIEVDKEQLSDFTRIIRILKKKKQKFIIFVDDLVFAENEASYSALKTILEGRIENRPSNILIYATTNRRHLVKENFSDRDDIHGRDTQEEQLSLADRFGITISFFTPDQKSYLEIVQGIVDTRGLKVDREYLNSEALKWEKWHNGRSPRSAKQFVDWLEGEILSH